jgi:MAP/microtubule affinity-regulating kinase
MYEHIKLLGEGGFGKVFLGRHKEKGTEVAIKYIDITEHL